MINLLKKIKCKIFSIIKKLYIRLLKYYKIDNKKIVFDNFNGKGFGCNPKYIALELIKENVDCKMIWLVEDMSLEMPQEIKKVKRGSLKSFYELATAKIWIDNVRNYKGIEKKKNQYYIQTWHGSLALKKVEKEVESMLSKSYVEEAKKDGQITDLMISDSFFATNRYSKNFWYNGEIKEIGIPRNDIFFSDDNYKIKEKVYEYYNIEKDKKIIIFAPSFRNDENNVEAYLFDFNLIKNAIEKKFENKYVFLIRLHPNISFLGSKLDNIQGVINATSYQDMQELLVAADICITDYSSIMFDFAMMYKPVLLFCKDFEDYINNERGLEFNLKDLPFKISKNENELIDTINNFDEEKYYTNYDSFFDRNDVKFKRYKDASYNLVQIIKNQINN